MSSKFSNKYPIPEKFPEILHDFSREVLRYMPKDILDFAIQYFYSLETSNPLNYIEGASKTIPRVVETISEKKHQMKDKRQDISTPSITTNQNTQNVFFKQGEQSEKKVEDEKEDIKEVKETNSSKINSPLHSEASRPGSEQSNGSGIVRASKLFVNNIFESSQLKVKESLNLYGKNMKNKKWKNTLEMKINIIKADILFQVFLVILRIKMLLDILLGMFLAKLKKRIRKYKN